MFKLVPQKYIFQKALVYYTHYLYIYRKFHTYYNCLFQTPISVTSNSGAYSAEMNYLFIHL